MSIRKYILPVFILPAVLVFAGCTAAVEVHAGSDKNTTVQYSASFGSAFIHTMRSFSDDPSAPLFDADTIAAQLRSSGIQDAEVKTPSGTALAVSASIPAGSKNTVSAAGLVTYNDSSNEMTLTLSPSALAALYTSLPETIQSYIDLFMAPVFSGDSMTAKDYIELVASVYGRPLADEVAAAQVSISLYPPAGTGAKKSISVSLTDILTAQDPLVYSVQW
jgi:hypothetical protein